MKMRVSTFFQVQFLIMALAVCLHAAQGSQPAKATRAPATSSPSQAQPAAQPAQAEEPQAVAAVAAAIKTAIVLKPGIVGTAYTDSGEIMAKGGSGTLSWAKTNGSLPPGLSISSAGKISGMPTSGKSDPYLFELTVSDSSAPPQTKSMMYLITVPAVPLEIINTSAAPNAAADPVAKTPTILANSIYQGGDTISGSVLLDQKTGGGSSNGAGAPAAGNGAPAAAAPAHAATCPAGTVVTLVSDDKIPVTANANPDCSFSYQFSGHFNSDTQIGAHYGAGGDVPFLLLARALPMPQIFGEELRAIVGYQQTGASSSNFTQNWFTDFFISRPILLKRFDEGANGNVIGNLFRWWGNVRVASFPQAGNQTVATIATGLPAEVGALKLNQLAQGAEFLSGLEGIFYRTQPVRGFSENTLQTFNFGIFAGFGATGFFSSPTNNVQIYQVPASNSPQLPAFQQSYGNVTTPYVGFIQPDVQRFQKEYLAGLRLTTRYVDPSGMPLTTAPAMIAVSLGQNQVITADHLTGIIGRFEAFYPLPFANRGKGVVGAFSSLYLFGTAQMRLGGHYAPAPSLVLGPAPSTVNPYDSNVTLVSTPSRRDVYSIGFGVDMVSLISQLTGGSAKTATGNAKSANGASSPAAPAAAPQPVAAPQAAAAPQPPAPAPAN